MPSVKKVLGRRPGRPEDRKFRFWLYVWLIKIAVLVAGLIAIAYFWVQRS